MIVFAYLSGKWVLVRELGPEKYVKDSGNTRGKTVQVQPSPASSNDRVRQMRCGVEEVSLDKGMFSFSVVSASTTAAPAAPTASAQRGHTRSATDNNNHPVRCLAPAAAAESKKKLVDDVGTNACRLEHTVHVSDRQGEDEKLDAQAPVMGQPIEWNTGGPVSARFLVSKVRRVGPVAHHVQK